MSSFRSLTAYIVAFSILHKLSRIPSISIFLLEEIKNYIYKNGLNLRKLRRPNYSTRQSLEISGKD